MTNDFNHCERQFRSRRIRACRGMSLLEVTIGTMMVAVVTMMAASVSIDLTRGISQNVMRTRLATEARLAIESFRRDFGGSDPDRPEGDRSEWNLVDYRIPSETECSCATTVMLMDQRTGSFRIE